MPLTRLALLAFLVCILSFLFLALNATGSVLYEDVIAQTGDNPVGGTGTFPILVTSPSMNAQGQMAFHGAMNGGDNGWFVGEGRTPFALAGERATHQIHRAVQIINQELNSYSCRGYGQAHPLTHQFNIPLRSAKRQQSDGG